MTTISLCMIVKDEAECLARCLKSAAPFVDEIVVVDTGSTDNTVEIARGFGAKVSHFAWAGHFADARNASLQQASGDWILVLDADEELLEGHQLHQLAAAADTRRIAWLLKFRNLQEKGESEHYHARFFPNHPDIRFAGRIHEQIEGPLRHVYAGTQAHILHYGYQTEIVRAKGKHERNLQLLQQAIAQDPDQAFHYFNLGVAYRSVDQPEREREAFEHCIALCDRETAFLPLAYTYLMSTLLRLNRPAEALQLAAECADMNERSPDYFCNLGSALNSLGRPSQALQAFTQAQACVDSLTLMSEVSARTWKPLAGLAEACRQMGHFDLATDYYHQALALSPGHPELERALKQLEAACL